MATTTLSDLLTLLDERSNFENSGVFSQSEKITYLNNSLAELYEILITTYEDYDSHTFLSTLSGVSNTIPLPNDVAKVRLVEYKFMLGSSQLGATDNYYPINMFQMPQRNRYGNTPPSILLPYQFAQLTYRVMGNNIIIEPCASAVGEFRVWYVQKWQNLVNLSDQLPIVMDTNAWSEYAIVSSCIKMMNKINLDASGFVAEKAELKDRIVSAAKNRTLAGPKCMINVRRRGRYGLGNGGFSPGGM